MYKGSLAIAGEFMGPRPFSMHNEPEFLELSKILHEADTAYCHLEMNLHGKGAYPGRPFATWCMEADPGMANELKWLGIDLVSCAFNHALDYGIPSVSGTIESLDKAGLVHAGTGNNLEEAREPAYFESKTGRVAIISMSSGHHPYDSASPVKAPVRGRPGVNPLRVIQRHVVTPDTLEKLKETWRMLGLSIRQPFFMKEEKGDNYLVVGDYGGTATTIIFQVGDKPEVKTKPNKWDLDGNIRAIKDARRQADLVIVAHHVSLNEGKRGYTPCKFVPPFAKECIDAGADVFVGHGWHRQLGIEIYKGKPIIYGTGNFFEQAQFLERFPSDVYEGFGFNLDDLPKLTPADVHDAHEKFIPTSKEQPGTVIATLNMEAGKFCEMKLYPYALGYALGADGARKTGTRIEGRPMLAHGDNAKIIIDHVSKLSEQYNTHIKYEDGIGVVDMT